MNGPPLLTHDDNHGVLTLTLNRPEVRNALDEATIDALLSACEEIARRDDVRAVVLRGNGKAFCSGADVGWMERLSGASKEENRSDAYRFARMLSALDSLPQPLIGAVHGAAVGGAIGLVAACDAVIASAETAFQFSETRIGLVPATIAPLVIAKTGAAQARYLFLSARRFDATRAMAIGLVQEVVPGPEALDGAVEGLLEDVLAGGPGAHRAAKRMARDLARRAASPEEMADLLARVRASDEAREGFRAFREKRSPRWRTGSER